MIGTHPHLIYTAADAMHVLWIGNRLTASAAERHSALSACAVHLRHYSWHNGPTLPLVRGNHSLISESLLRSTSWQVQMRHCVR